MSTTDKPARLNVRCTPEQAQTIRKAAELELRTVSNFVTFAAVQRAEEIVEKIRQSA